MPLPWSSPAPRRVPGSRPAPVPGSSHQPSRRGVVETRRATPSTATSHRIRRAYRPGQHGTWITNEMIKGYGALHERGYAHSVECWIDGALAGGLYNVSLDGAFFGESMYADAPDASKIAFVTLLGNTLH